MNSFLILDIENSNIRVTKNFFEENDDKENLNNTYKILLTVQKDKYFVSLVKHNVPNLEKQFSGDISVSKDYCELKSDHTCHTRDILGRNYNIFSYIQNLLNLSSKIDSCLLINTNGRIKTKRDKISFKIEKSEYNSNIFNIFEVRKGLSIENFVQTTHYLLLNSYLKDRVIIDNVKLCKIPYLAIENKYKTITKKIFNYTYISNSTSILSNYLNKINNPYSYRNKSTVSLIDRKYKVLISNSDYSKIGYLDYKDYLKTRFENITFNYISETIDKPLSIGKVLADYTELTNEQIEKIVNIEKALNEELTIELIKGEDIIKYYNHKSYLSTSGELGSSCMRYDGYENKIKFYALNDNVELAIQRVEDKILSRALIWTDNEGNKLMDRVYALNNSRILQYLKWAKDNNIINIYEFRECSMNNRDYTKLGVSNWGSSYAKDFNIELNYIPKVLLDCNKAYNPKAFTETSENTMDMPYMDNFKYMDISNKLLTTKILKNTVYICCISGESMPENCVIRLYDGDIVHSRYLANGQVVPVYNDDLFETPRYYYRDNCNQSLIHDAYLLPEESVYSEYHKTFIHRDSSIILHDLGIYILATHYDKACKHYKIGAYEVLEEFIYTEEEELEELEEDLPF
jgi:hypothetical protein